MNDAADASPRPLTNVVIAAAFRELAARLAAAGEKDYGTQAYVRAANVIAGSATSVGLLAREGRAQELDGVGPAIERKIADLCATGTFAALERARVEAPDALLQLVSVPGIGPGVARKIWAEVGPDVGWFGIVAAADDGRLRAIAGVGPKAVRAIQEATEPPVPTWADEGAPELLRSTAERFEATVLDLVVRACPSAVAAGSGGPLARGAELVDRVATVVAIEEPREAARAVGQLFASHGWTGVEAQPGDQVTVVAGTAPSGLPVRVVLCEPPAVPLGHLLAVGPDVHAAAVLAGIGPEAAARPIAVAKVAGGYVLPDAPIYERAGLQPVPPELRDRPAALRQASEGTLPDLVRVEQLQGELHCHSDWSDGRAPLLDMARAALARGDRYLAITDHSAPFAMVNGLTPERLREQAREIARANEELAGELRVVQGTELEVLADGSLGLDDDTLAGLDWVVASIHQDQRQDAATVQARIERVLRHPLVDLIGHPTSRLLLRRPPTAIDTDRLIEVALETGTLLEVNASPERLDLDSGLARQALEAGVLICIDSDAHGPETLALRRHGVAIARRAGATAAQIVNTRDRWDDVEALRKRHRQR